MGGGSVGSGFGGLGFKFRVGDCMGGVADPPGLPDSIVLSNLIAS